jgi:hypothetical protein
VTDSLATQILAAAVTLTQLNARLGNGSDMRWNASELRREAEHVEAEDQEAETRDRHIGWRLRTPGCWASLRFYGGRPTPYVPQGATGEREGERGHRERHPSNPRRRRTWLTPRPQ